MQTAYTQISTDNGSRLKKEKKKSGCVKPTRYYRSAELQRFHLNNIQENAKDLT